MTNKTMEIEMLRRMEEEGKTEFSFDEIAELERKHNGIPEEETNRILHETAKEQREKKMKNKMFLNAIFLI